MRALEPYVTAYSSAYPRASSHLMVYRPTSIYSFCLSGCINLSKPSWVTPLKSISGCMIISIGILV